MRQPNKPHSMTKATSFTVGEAIKKENVTPKGSPASTKPMNIGIAEQEQNGVTMPRQAAKKFPTYSRRLARSLRDFSGGKKLRITATTKIMTVRRKKTFMVSYKKKLRASPNMVPCLI